MTEQTSTEAPARSISGWIEAGIFVLCIAFLSLAYNIGAAHNTHASVFVLYSLLISAAALLAFTGPGPNAWAIVRNGASWGVGIANMVVEGGYAVLLGYVPPADGSLMIRLSIPVTFLIGVLVFARRPSLAAWVGATLVGAAVIHLILDVEPSKQAIVTACAAACGIAVGIRAFASEYHVWNRAARTVREKIQVTALVTLVTALAGLVAVGGLMMAVVLGHLPATPLLPTRQDMIHPPTIILALMVGGALFTAMTYLSFSCVVKIQAENFIATSAFMPLATLGVQTVAAAAGLITLPPFDWRLLPAILVTIVGVMMMIWGNRKVWQ
jgi:drug/metabolite transporter (DMT)-like permease